jgi:hypothetical protein
LGIDWEVAFQSKLNKLAESILASVRSNAIVHVDFRDSIIFDNTRKPFT